jgi:V8-like Glu-specific endopeptidase
MAGWQTYKPSDVQPLTSSYAVDQEIDLLCKPTLEERWGMKKTIVQWSIQLSVSALTVQLLAAPFPASAQSPSNDARKAVKESSDEQLRREFLRRFEVRSGAPRASTEKSDVSPPSAEKSGTRAIEPPISQLDDGAIVEATRAEGRSRVIYGTDDRKDWYEIKDPGILALARASVALFSPIDIPGGSDGAVRLKLRSLKDVYGLCADEKFVSQPKGAFCSGTLVGPDLVLTAGHCVREISGSGSVPAITSTRFVFGYQMRNESSYATISPAQVYTGREVIGGTMNTKADDWALVRLSRPVPGTIAEPVSNWDPTPVKRDQKVFVVGYPSGIPLKYAPGAIVRDNSDPNFFVTNLDTFGGNSGSGVYDETSNRLIGVLVRGETDYVADQAKSCFRANICPTSGCRGEDVTRISTVHKP